MSVYYIYICVCVIICVWCDYVCLYPQVYVHTRVCVCVRMCKISRSSSEVSCKTGMCFASSSCDAAAVRKPFLRLTHPATGPEICCSFFPVVETSKM